MAPYRSSLFVFVFWLINIIDDVTAAILVEKRWHCHGHSFGPIFLKFGMWVPARITRFGIADQRSTSPTSGQNDGWKNR